MGKIDYNYPIFVIYAPMLSNQMANELMHHIDNIGLKNTMLFVEERDTPSFKVECIWSPNNFLNDENYNKVKELINKINDMDDKIMSSTSKQIIRELKIFLLTHVNNN